MVSGGTCSKLSHQITVPTDGGLPDDVHDNFLQITYTAARRRVWAGKGI